MSSVSQLTSSNWSDVHVQFMCVRVHKDCLALILLHSYHIDSEMSDVSLDPLTRIVLCSIGRSPEEGGCAPVCS